MQKRAPASGYSGTPLPKKLGIKEGQSVLLIGMPAGLLAPAALKSFNMLETLESCPQSRRDTPKGPFDYIHLFTSDSGQLQKTLPLLRGALKPDGMLWVSWPKRASKVATDVTEDVIRALALGHALVDIKVCAVDAVWSGLKLVIPRHMR